MKYFKSYYKVNSTELHVRAVYFSGQIEGEVKINEESCDFSWFSKEKLLSEKIKLAFGQNEVLEDYWDK